ncbi:PAS domain S-box protein [Halopenitus sp. H-Gu1]|uniref:PAS domain S-box protein n=1 Tax=Halopenitus sp. H-Gu1 TaxID=3242697 RepID=UPI00359D49CA
MEPPIHVLHVDDEADFGEMVATYLQREDEQIEVYTATSPEEGLEILVDRDIDCIVSDYDMPGYNGIEFLDLVQEEHPTIPFILYTGKGSEEIASEAISAGVTDYLQKEPGTEQYTILANRIINAVNQARSDQEVERIREYFRTILDQASDYVMIVGEDGQVDYISPAVERVLGYSPEELKQRDAFEYIHPDDQSTATAGFTELFEHPDQEHTVEFRARHADGSWRWLEVRGRNLLDDPVIEGVMVNVRDITERKEREQDLERQEFLFRRVQDIADIGVWEYDIQKEELSWSDGVRPILGVEDDFELTIEKGLEFYHPEDRDEIRRVFNEAIEDGTEYDRELRIVRPDDTVRYVRSYGEVRTDGSGNAAVLRGVFQDITERIEREKQLLRYEYAFKSSLSGIAVANLDGEVTNVNPASLEMWGYDDRDDVIGRSVTEFWKDPEKAASGLETMKEQGNWEGILEAVRADGSTFYARGAASLLTDDEGEPIGVMSSFVDITERKRRERELRAEKEKYSTLVEQSHDVITVIQDGEIKFVNQEVTETLGYEKSDLLGKPFLEVIAPEDRDRLIERYLQRLDPESKSPPSQYDAHFLAKDGEQRVANISAATIQYEGEPADLVALRDQTERKRYEEKLAEAKERYESLFDSIRDAILVEDADRRIINANPTFTDLFGYELEAIEGKSTRYLYESEDEFEAMGEAIEDHIDDPKITHTVAFEKESGQTFPGEINMSYLRDASGEVIGFIGIIRDITGRIERLRQIYMVDRILQHNFNNDMNVIEGYAENIRDATTGEIASSASKILKSSQKLLQTVEKEHDVTEFLASQPETTTHEIGQEVATLVSDMRERYPDAEISMDIQSEATVRAVPEITLAIEEVLQNAIIHADTDSPRIQVQVEVCDNTLEISVADNNPHIPEMEHKVLMEGEEMTPLYHGSGIGLWLVNLIVAHSDGVVDVEATEPRGNEVTIRLPAGN